MNLATYERLNEGNFACPLVTLTLSNILFIYTNDSDSQISYSVVAIFLTCFSGSGKPAEADTVVMTDQSDPEGGTWDDEEDATQYNYRYNRNITAVKLTILAIFISCSLLALFTS